MFTRNYDIRETDNAFEVQMEMSGYAPADISISSDADLLTIKAERESWHGKRKITKAFSLPSTIDRDNITASYTLGLLTLALPKRSADVRRSIPVQAIAEARNTG